MVSPVTGVRQMAQRHDHLPQLSRAHLQLRDVVKGERLHVGAAALAVAPELEEVAYARKRKAEIARAAYELQPADVRIAILSVAAVCPAGGG